MPERLSIISRYLLLSVIIAASGLLMLNAANGDSAIVDELAHIPAGYGYVHYLDYRLNPEHPPLVKALAALPLLFQKVNFPGDSKEWLSGINEQWTIGAKFLYESGNDADKIIFWSRLGPIALTLILIIAVYFMSASLIGKWWALLPTFLVAFSPNFLAHGHYVTTDVGATLGIFAATSAYLNYLLSPSSKKLWLAGLIFGLAQLTKFSVAILIPFFVGITAIYYLANILRGWQLPKKFWSYIWSLIIIFLIGYALVFAFYLVFTWNYPLSKQVEDTKFILTSFTPRWLANFAVWLAGIPILRGAGEYLLGLLMTLRRSSGGNTAYFLGEVSNSGWWYYFPLVFLMKEPIASLLMILFALILSSLKAVKYFFAAIFRKSNQLLDYINTYFVEFSMLIFVVGYWGLSILSRLNIGVRHVLPTLPFIYILTVSALKQWFSVRDFKNVKNWVIKIFVAYQEFINLSVKSAILILLLLGYLLSVILATPDYLSYFNLAAGGLKNGYRYVTDSNYDWGQDLKRLKVWVEENKVDKIAVDYFGGGSPRYYLGDFAQLWWSAKGSPINEGINWLAISINTIQSAKGQLVSRLERKPEDEYRWLTEPYKPYVRAGTSIFIYKLE